MNAEQVVPWEMATATISGAAAEASSIVAITH
jgi:hypothetical protein